MNKQLNPAGQGITIDAGAMDLNRDNYIDIGEYATSILLSDMLSTDENNFSVKNINGKITNKGENALLINSGNREVQYTAYKYLYDYYNLGQAKRDFIQNPNNCCVVN